MHKPKSILCFATAFFVSYAAHCAALNWTDSALKLSSDPIERANGIEELKKIPDLNTQLGKNLWNEKSELAIAVISSLKLNEFYPKIYKKIQSTAGKNLNWKWIQTATDLARAEDQEALSTLYQSKLGQSDLSPQALIALLGSLETLQHEVDEKKLAAYLSHPSHEVRQEAIQIAGRLVMEKPQYGLVLKNAIVTSPYQVRLLAYDAFSSKPTLIAKYKSDIEASCNKEANDKVKATCIQVVKR